MSYFEDYDLKKKFLHNDRGVLRNCQYGALLSVISHFTASSEPAIVSLPTGSGKTELMYSLAFSLQPKRVLRIEPSLFLRRQTANKMEALSLFREFDLLDTEEHPRVKQVFKSLQTDQNWEQLREYDVVVATPKTVSPEEALVCDPPDDLFDIILIDEAHHAAAKTWRAIVNSYVKSKTVLLTATAFRRDRRRLPGRLVYHYPVGRALADNIYRPIKFHPVERRDIGNVDSDIAEAAVEKLNEERVGNPDASMLIRTDRILKCGELKDIYAQLGLDAVVIHSDLGKREAETRLQQLRNGEVFAAITVGMIAEGIDIPGLKVAALHAPPRSLPYTLQIVGRVSRTPENQTGEAWLITVPQDVRGEARRLFREDREWHKFIPSLIEDAIHEAHGDRADVILSEASASSLIPEILTPYFSVEIKKFMQPNGKIHDNRLPLILEDVKDLPRDVEQIEALTEVTDGCLTLVTSSSKRPAWGRETELIESKFDLHIIYSPPGSGLIFLTTTSPIIINALLGALADDMQSIDARNVQGALVDAIVSDYSAVGLENALGLTGTHPSYKMHLGAGSGTSVRPSDGAIYGAGHAMGRMLNNELRGAATKNRKVWAMRREPLQDFTTWCDELATQISTPAGGLPGLTFLSQPVPAVDLFTESPIGIIISDRQFSFPHQSLVQRKDGDIPATLDPIFSTWDISDDILETALKFRDDSDPISITFTPATGVKHWRVTDTRSFEFVDPITGTRTDLEKFINEFPPIILMPRGGAIRGDYGWEILMGEPDLPTNIVRDIEWGANTNIRLEAKTDENGKMNVQDRTLEVLISEMPNDTIILIDDAAWEIADFVTINPTPKEISFIHVKFSSEDEPGNRVKDWYELFGQSSRSHSWIRRGNLLSDLEQRIGRRQDTALVPNMGTRADLAELITNYKPNEWKFKVLAVQPGCKIEKLLRQQDSHVYVGLAAVREWLLQAGASFSVWGS